MTPPSPSLRPGALIGRKYRVERVIGQGGMGTVVLATHVTLRTPFAVKIILPENAASLPAKQRLMEEAQNASRIPGNHVVRVVDAEILPDGLAYLAMEFLEGMDLSEAIRLRGRLPHDEVVEIVGQICEALEGAHRLGIVHRDIKPSNIFLTRTDDGSTIAKVLDFGISKDTTDLHRRDLTATVSTLGSPLYLSPEQMKNPRSVDGRSDLWSLGVVLFEALAGVPPFDGETAAGLSISIATEAPRDLEALAPGAPDPLRCVITRCLEKDRERRYATALELRQALFASVGREPGPAERASLHSFPEFTESRTQIYVAPARPRLASSPASAAGGPGGEPAAASPVATGAGLGRTVVESAVVPVRRVPLGVWFVGAAASAVAVGVAVVLVVGRTESSSPDLERGAGASEASPEASSAADESANASPPPVVSVVASAEALPQPHVGEAPSAHSQAKSESAAGGARTAPPPKRSPGPTSDCTPPYWVDRKGVRRFKSQCM